MIAALLTAAVVAGGGPVTDYIYTCDDTPTVIAHFKERAVGLRIGKREVVLAQARAGSGARYTDGTIVFWIKGSAATLDTGHGAISNCRVTDRG